MVLNWFVESEEVFMLQMVSPLILKLSLFLVTAVATHLVMSFGQTFLHYKVAHNPIGGKLFRNHINFHHTHYAEDHLVSRTYLGDEGNITPYFLIPVFLVGGCVYFLLPLNLFVVTVITSAASFYAHVFFDKEYHVEGSRLQRFAWFRREFDGPVHDAREIAAIFRATIGQHAAELHLVGVVEGHDPIVEQVGGGDRRLARS